MIRKLACCVLGFGHEEEGLPTLLTHFFLAFEEVLHDFLELLLEGICLALKQFVAFLGSCDFLLEQLQIPTSTFVYILLAVI